ncbi:DUF429 domain-containing protein [Oleidesulfovibrio sp.]|uniref:DUF429 domain-containing protein n=1 Tax=Oleidesulfovibrio sp. TaxID=2909707 RepID=UPI003A8A031D
MRCSPSCPTCTHPDSFAASHGPLAVLGIDVTSAPDKRKPLACAVGVLNNDTLRIKQLYAVTALRGLPDCTRESASHPQAAELSETTPVSLEHLLAHEGPWVAGFDMPFGLPADFLRWWQETEEPQNKLAETRQNDQPEVSPAHKDNAHAGPQDNYGQSCGCSTVGAASGYVRMSAHAGIQQPSAFAYQKNTKATQAKAVLCMNTASAAQPDAERTTAFRPLPSWHHYVSRLALLDKEAFRQTVYAFMNTRPKGQKLPLRLTDNLTDAQSPLRLNYVPVGRMFHAVVPLLTESAVRIPLLHENGDCRVALEVYPALIARDILGNPPRYKDGSKEQQQERKQARAALIHTLPDYCQSRYGFTLQIEAQQKEVVLEDTKGDMLDALLCAIQAAGAARQKNFGMPELVSETMRSEGWIAAG